MPHVMVDGQPLYMPHEIDTNADDFAPAFYRGVKDSGKRQEFSTGAVRDTEEGKGMPSLIPTMPLRRLAQHYANGCKKYNRDNWKLGIPLSRFLDSAQRHLWSMMEGDEGEDHASALEFNSMGYTWTLDKIRKGELPQELDDMGHK